jgi:hypothetical protein
VLPNLQSPCKMPTTDFTQPPDVRDLLPPGLDDDCSKTTGGLSQPPMFGGINPFADENEPTVDLLGSSYARIGSSAATSGYPGAPSTLNISTDLFTTGN